MDRISKRSSTRELSHSGCGWKRHKKQSLNIINFKQYHVEMIAPFVYENGFLF